MFEINYSNQSIKFLKKADKNLLKRLLDKIEQMQSQPISIGTKKLHGINNMFKVRVGDYRILYEIDFNKNNVGIVKIDKRDSVY